MAAKVVNFIEEYATAPIVKKIDIILEYFSGFEKIIEGYEKCISIQIRNEREFNRRKDYAELGVRVQTSNISDTTQKIAIENVSIQEAIRAGDMDEALRGAEEIERHRREIQTLNDMRDDYVIVSSQVYLLQGADLSIFTRYLSKLESMSSIAEDTHIEYVMDCLLSNTTKVCNIKKYILAALFNAPTTMGGYFRTEVNHDMPQLAKAR